MKKNEDELFADLLADKRHKELVGALRVISTSLNKEDNTAIVDAIYAQGLNTDKLIGLIKQAQRQEQPIVDINNDKISDALNQICIDIIASNNKVIEALEGRLLPDTFEMLREYGGVVQSVKVNYKSSKEIKNYYNGR
jgi:hypothetical protein